MPEQRPKIEGTILQPGKVDATPPGTPKNALDRIRDKERDALLWAKKSAKEGTYKMEDLLKEQPDYLRERFPTANVARLDRLALSRWLQAPEAEAIIREASRTAWEAYERTINEAAQQAIEKEVGLERPDTTFQDEWRNAQEDIARLSPQEIADKEKEAEQHFIESAN